MPGLNLRMLEKRFAAAEEKERFIEEKYHGKRVASAKHGGSRAGAGVGTEKADFDNGDAASERISITAINGVPTAIASSSSRSSVSALHHQQQQGIVGDMRKGTRATVQLVTTSKEARDSLEGAYGTASLRVRDRVREAFLEQQARIAEMRKEAAKENAFRLEQHEQMYGSTSGQGLAAAATSSRVGAGGVAMYAVERNNTNSGVGANNNASIGPQSAGSANTETQTSSRAQKGFGIEEEGNSASPFASSFFSRAAASRPRTAADATASGTSKTSAPSSTSGGLFDNLNTLEDLLELRKRGVRTPNGATKDSRREGQQQGYNKKNVAPLSSHEINNADDQNVERVRDDQEDESEGEGDLGQTQAPTSNEMDLSCSSDNSEDKLGQHVKENDAARARGKGSFFNHRPLHKHTSKGDNQSFPPPLASSSHSATHSPSSSAVSSPQKPMLKRGGTEAYLYNNAQRKERSGPVDDRPKPKGAGSDSYTDVNDDNDDDEEERGIRERRENSNTVRESKGRVGGELGGANENDSAKATLLSSSGSRRTASAGRRTSSLGIASYLTRLQPSLSASTNRPESLLRYQRGKGSQQHPSNIIDVSVSPALFEMGNTLKRGGGMMSGGVGKRGGASGLYQGDGFASSSLAQRFRNPRPIHIPKRPLTAGGGGEDEEEARRRGKGNGGGNMDRPASANGSMKGTAAGGGGGGGATTYTTINEANAFNSQFRAPADALASLRHMLAPGIGIPPPPLVPPRFYPKRWPSRPSSPLSPETVTNNNAANAKGQPIHVQTAVASSAEGIPAGVGITNGRRKTLEKIAATTDGYAQQQASSSFTSPQGGRPFPSPSSLSNTMHGGSGVDSAASTLVVGGVLSKYSALNHHFATLSRCPAPAMEKDFYYIHIRVQHETDLRDWVFTVVITDVTPIAVEILRERRWAGTDTNDTNGGQIIVRDGAEVDGRDLGLGEIDGTSPFPHTDNTVSPARSVARLRSARPPSSSSSSSLINSKSAQNNPFGFPATIPSSTTQVDLSLVGVSSGPNSRTPAVPLSSPPTFSSSEEANHTQQHVFAAASEGGGILGNLIVSNMAEERAASSRAAMSGISMLQSRPLSSSGRPPGVGMIVSPQHIGKYANTTTSASNTNNSNTTRNGKQTYNEEGAYDNDNNVDAGNRREVRIYRHTISGVKVDHHKYLIFHPPNGSTFSPCDDVPWVPCPSYLYGRSLRIEVYATKPTRTKVVDTTVNYGDD